MGSLLWHRPMPRVWTAKHVGNLDLLRACLSHGLSDWAEETRAEPEHGCRCEVLFCDRWLSIPGGIPLDYRQLAGWHTAISRIEGMSHAADKVNMEQALARCRDAGLPGYSDETGSCFPLAWILPEQLSENISELFGHAHDGKASASLYLVTFPQLPPRT